MMKPSRLLFMGSLRSPCFCGCLISGNSVCNQLLFFFFPSTNAFFPCCQISFELSFTSGKFLRQVNPSIMIDLNPYLVSQAFLSFLGKLFCLYFVLFGNAFSAHEGCFLVDKTIEMTFPMRYRNSVFTCLVVGISSGQMMCHVVTLLAVFFVIVKPKPLLKALFYHLL